MDIKDKIIYILIGLLILVFFSLLEKISNNKFLTRENKSLKKEISRITTELEVYKQTIPDILRKVTSEYEYRFARYRRSESEILFSELHHFNQIMSSIDELKTHILKGKLSDELTEEDYNGEKN